MNILDILTKNYFYLTVWNYLRPIDKLALSLVCKDLRKIYFIDVDLLVMIGLEKRMKDPDLILSKLKPERCIISGSFLLQILYDEDWMSDINIFMITDDIRYEDNPEEDVNLESRLLTGGYQHENSNYDAWKEFGPFLFSSKMCSMLNDYIISPIYYTRAEFTKLVDVIDHYFDFDVCKIIYDGDRLRIRNLAAIIKKRISVTIKPYLNNMSEDGINRLRCVERDRIIKYQCRGFTIY